MDNLLRQSKNTIPLVAQLTMKEEPHIIKIKGAVQCCEERRQKAESMLGLFILSTNDISESLGMQALLEHYKSQQSAERGFCFLKSPDFLVSSLFLKKPERIEALLMIMTCCLMDYAALEYLIRTTLKENDAYFQGMKKKVKSKSYCKFPSIRPLNYLLNSRLV
jgi:transposase